MVKKEKRGIGRAGKEGREGFRGEMRKSGKRRKIRARFEEEQKV